MLILLLLNQSNLIKRENVSVLAKKKALASSCLLLRVHFGQTIEIIKPRMLQALQMLCDFQSNTLIPLNPWSEKSNSVELTNWEQQKNLILMGCEWVMNHSCTLHPRMFGKFRKKIFIVQWGIYKGLLRCVSRSIGHDWWSLKDWFQPQCDGTEVPNPGLCLTASRSFFSYHAK